MFYPSIKKLHCTSQLGLCLRYLFLYNEMQRLLLFVMYGIFLVALARPCVLVFPIYSLQCERDP